MQSTAQLPYLSVIVIGWLSSYDIHVLVVATCNHTNHTHTVIDQERMIAFVVFVVNVNKCVHDVYVAFLLTLILLPSLTLNNCVRLG